MSLLPSLQLLILSILPPCGSVFPELAILGSYPFFPKSYNSWRTLTRLSRVSFRLWKLSCLTDAELKLGCNSIRGHITLRYNDLFKHLSCLSVKGKDWVSFIFVLPSHTVLYTVLFLPHRKYSISSWVSEWVGNQSRLESPSFSGYTAF